MKNQNTSQKSRAERHAELQKQSLEKPGVKEMLEVYNRWQLAHQAVQAHQDIKNAGYKIISSNSSDPKSFFQES